MGMKWISPDVPGLSCEYVEADGNPMDGIGKVAFKAPKLKRDEELIVDGRCTSHPRALVRFARSVISGCPICAKASAAPEPTTDVREEAMREAEAEDGPQS